MQRAACLRIVPCRDSAALHGFARAVLGDGVDDPRTRVLTLSSPAHVEEVLRSGDFFVATDGNLTVGCVGYRRGLVLRRRDGVREESPEAWQLCGLLVAPWRRGQGIARALMERALRALGETGAPEAHLIVTGRYDGSLGVPRPDSVRIAALCTTMGGVEVGYGERSGGPVFRIPVPPPEGLSPAG